MDKDTLFRPSFGDKSGLGWMYDARRDIFLSSGILQPSMPETLIRSDDTNASVSKIISNDAWSKTFSELDISKNTCLSLLSGTVKLNGVIGNCLKYVQEESRGSKTALLYQIHTVSEQIDLFSEELTPFLLLDAIDHVNATHIVVKTNWGATSLVSMEVAKPPQSNLDDINKKLLALCDGLRSMLNDENPNVANSVKDSEFEQITIKLNSDILPKEKLFTNVQDLRATLKLLPDFVNGKGNILSYEMIPLSLLTNRLNLNITGGAIFHNVGDEITSKFVQLFDDMKQLAFRTPNLNNDEICKFKELLTKTEMKLKQDLASIVVKVRSGEADESTLEILLNKYRKEQIYLEDVKNQSQNEVKSKMIATLSSKNVSIISNLLDLNSLHTQNVAISTYLLIYNSKSACENEENWKSHWSTFHQLIESCNVRDNVEFAFLDNDVVDNPELKTIAIHQLKGGKTISINVHSEVQEMAQLCLAHSSAINPRMKKSTKRGNVLLQCPGAFLKKDPCPDVPHKWQCKTCLDVLHYGFDLNFYCSCGGAPYVSYEFRCSHAESHALCYFKFNDNIQRLHSAIQEIEPYKELNIVILGETGVGKSTWINGFANYLTYDTLDTALAYKPLCLIPISFNIGGTKIELGKKDKNETCATGHSSTQKPKSYVFFANDTRVCLVDTPGIGDTRGIAQDRTNFQNIMSHLAFVEELHGICILLKPNQARLDITFQFCIQELLTHLHKDACRNIVFVYTNARNTFYRGGDTAPVLEQLLKKKIGNAIDLGIDKSYYMDNEAVRFLAAKKNGVEFTEEEFQIYAQSWLKSVSENKRLMHHLLQLPAHQSANTRSLNEVRRMILELTEPLTKISQNIQDNITIMKRKKVEMEAKDRNKKDLCKKLYIPYTELISEPISQPRTVCTNSSCVDVLTDKDGKQIIDYKTWCHEKCRLKDVVVQKYPIPELQNCNAMDQNGKCTKCNCMWNSHMHITYTSKQVLTKIIDKNTETQINTESDAINAIQNFIQSLDDYVRNLNAEQKQINATAAKFGNFLKSNAITPYNDATENYLKYQIEIEEGLAAKSKNGENLASLRNLLQKYYKEVNVLNENMKEGQQSSAFTSIEIQSLIENLYALPLNGEMLRKMMSVAINANTKMVEELATVYEPVLKQEKQNGTLMTVFVSAKNKTKHYYGTALKYLPWGKQ